MDAEYQVAVFNIYTNMLRKSVLWPALGNHDTAQVVAYVDTYPYFNIFTLPKNAGRWWRCFRHGALLFV